MAGIGRPHLDVDAVVGRLDELADDASHANCPMGVIEHVFGTHGFSGDSVDYYAASNSRIDQVLERRVGIPITLAAVVIEIGRRRGVGIEGVGFPGHFLLRASDDPDQFYDPFNPGRPMTRSECRTLFERLHGSLAAFDPAYLRSSDTAAIVTRVLNNLRYAHRRAGDPASELEVLCVLSRAPTAGASDAYDYACALADAGRYSQAVDAVGPFRDLDDRIARSIDRWLANLN